MDASELSMYSVDQLCDEYLADKVDEDVIVTFKTHKISGALFVSLEDEELKELFPTLGDRMAVRGLLSTFRGESVAVRSDLKLACPQTSRQDSRLDQSGLLSSNWAHTFQLPDCFSCKTMKAMRTRQITKSARIEIVAAMHTRMLQHTTYPTPPEYRTACMRMVDKYPVLADKLGSKIGSLKEQLKQKFRNGRRPDPADAKEKDKENSHPNMDDNVSEPAKKKQRKHCTSRSRIASEGILETDAEEHEQYEVHVQELAAELEEDNPRSSTIKSLMKQTFKGRRTWIVHDSPSVKEVLGVFPCLSQSSRLLRELTLILGVEKSTEFLKDWGLWRKRILDYAQVEAPHRPPINLLLQQYHAEDDHSDDCEGLYCLKLLSIFLASKAKIKLVYEYPASANLATEVRGMSTTSPYIVITTTDGDTKQYFVVVEKEVLLESSDMTQALQDLMSTYFTFNIAYPRPLYSILLFLQHHVFNIRDDQAIPNVVKIVYSAMCA